MAADAGLPTAGKKDSTGICFIGERHFREFLSRYLPARPGELQPPAGPMVRPHPGSVHSPLRHREGSQIGVLPRFPTATAVGLAPTAPRNLLAAPQGRPT